MSNSNGNGNASSSAAATTPRINLFDYTEEQLLGTTSGVQDKKSSSCNSTALTYYEILNLPVYATQNDVKKAYRKKAVIYHPDKTGRGEDDYVFLAVKAAYDTLFDSAKRQAYDSTVLPFDDSIPAPRATLLQDSLLLYTDDDFYETFGPVFQRNLRFDARLRPDLSKNSSNSNNHHHHHHHTAKHKRHPPSSPPPQLGDADTPLEQVHKFYEYWIHFESWRDFSAAAAKELEIEDHQLENAESRYEKRFYQKEIARRTKQLKKLELARIQKLVTTAMEADPRLRQERQDAAAAKERAAQQRALAKERERQRVLQQQQDAVLEQERIQVERARAKQERESVKKLLRKERQWLRQEAAADFEKNESNSNNNKMHWNDTYDMNLDVEYLCQSMELTQLREFNQQYKDCSNNSNNNGNGEAGLDLIRRTALQQRERDEQQQQQQQQVQKDEQSTASTGTNNNNSNGNNKSTSSSSLPWTKEELSALSKAIKKYPPGGASRWEQICLFVNNLCKQDVPRTREECISTYNQIARKGVVAGGSNVNSANSSSNKTTNGNSTSEAFAAASPDAATTTWSAEQDQQLQEALAKYPANMDKNERWTAIANAVDSKTKKQCVQRFKAIREALKSTKKK